MLVEAAFVLPVMLLFVAAIIDFGLAFKDLQTVFTATRVGARTASAETRQSGYATDVANAVKSSLNAVPSDGTRSSGSTRRTPTASPTAATSPAAPPVCAITGTTPPTWTKVQNSWPASGTGSQYACVASPGPDALGVYLKVRHDMLTGSSARPRR